MVDVRETETGQLGAIGEAAAHHQFTKLGWGAITVARHDLGTDLLLLARDHRLTDLGHPVGAQVKAGQSWFRERVVDESGEVIGWWYRENERKHLDYWATYAVPHLLVLHDEHTEISYWVHVRSELIEPAGKGAKILVPQANQINRDHLDALLEVAVSKRPALTWEGSVWANADDIAPDDRMRYALLAPRLVAPHRNSGSQQEVGAEQAIALLVEGRVREIDRFVDTPALGEMPESPDWAWRFAGAIELRLRTGQVDHLVAFAQDAPRSPWRVAATVAAAAGLVELARPDEAIPMLEAEVDRGEAGSVDHAWLLVQLARSYMEIGKLDEAGAVAAEALKVRLGKNSDVTATALAGVAAVQLFTMSDWAQKDTQAAVTGMDTAVNWWRTERVAAGSNAVVDRQFLAWTKRNAAVIEVEDVANNRLLTAALLASHVGDQAAWRRLNALNAKQAFARVTRSSDVQLVRGLLGELRTAGDDKALDQTITRLLNDGPAAAVSAAAADIDLSRWTRTTSKANLTLLRHGGDLLSEELAGRVVDWLVANGRAPQGFVSRTKPTYDIAFEFVRTLAGVLGSAAPDKQAAVAELVLTLPAQQHEGSAMAWCKVVRALPAKLWTPDRAARAVEIAPQHHELLRMYLLAAVQRTNQAAAELLLQEVEQHSPLALQLLDTATLIPAHVAQGLIAEMETRIDAIITDAARSSSSTYGYDWAGLLMALNLQHPEIARWEKIYDLIRDPLVAAEHKRPCCAVLAHKAVTLPDAVREELAPIALQVIASPSSPFDLAFGTGDSAVGPAAALAARLGGDLGTTSTLLLRLLGGDTGQRAWAARLAPEMSEEFAIGLLAGLANDDEWAVRVAAAVSLTTMRDNGVKNPLADEVLLRCAEDPGTSVPRCIATAPGTPEVVLRRLASHQSAEVRAAIAER